MEVITLDQLDKLETFLSSIPLDDHLADQYYNTIALISNKLLESNNIINFTEDDIINIYSENFDKISDFITIHELYHFYNDCIELLHENDSKFDINDEYTEEKFLYNGFIKSEFVIHEHDSKRAPLHWDFRFKTEFKTSAYSFVLLKHKMPDNDKEKLLVKRQPMHPPAWVDMDHTQIGEGYGQGSVKTIDRGIIYYKTKNNSFSFYILGNIYSGAYHLINLKNSIYLLFKAINNIVPSFEERNKEWIEYANNFIAYMNKVFKYRYKLNDNFISYNSIVIAPDLLQYINRTHLKDNNIIYIPDIASMIELQKSNNIQKIISTDCKINNIEDIMRLRILRDYIAPIFFNYYKIRNNNIIDDIYDKIRDVNYFDDELESFKNILNINDYKQEKVYRMFSDIYLGHKYYGQFDFERFLINYLKDLS